MNLIVANKPFFINKSMEDRLKSKRVCLHSVQECMRHTISIILSYFSIRFVVQARCLADAN